MNAGYDSVVEAEPARWWYGPVLSGISCAVQSSKQSLIENNEHPQNRYTVRLRCTTRLATISVLVLLLLLDAQHGPSVRDVYDGKLSLAAEVNTFRHIDQVFPSTTVKAGGHALPLPQPQHRFGTFLSPGADRRCISTVMSV